MSYGRSQQLATKPSPQCAGQVLRVTDGQQWFNVFSGIAIQPDGAQVFVIFVKPVSGTA